MVKNKGEQKQKREPLATTVYFWPPVYCPHCVKAGRAWSLPYTTHTRGIERYHTCSHPGCGKRFRSYEKRP